MHSAVANQYWNLSVIPLAYTYCIEVRVPFQGADMFLVKNRPEIIASEDSLA